MNIPMVSDRARLVAKQATAALHRWMQTLPPGQLSRAEKKRLHDRAKGDAIKGDRDGYNRGQNKRRSSTFAWNADRTNGADQCLRIPALVPKESGRNRDGTQRFKLVANPLGGNSPFMGPDALATQRHRARQTHPQKRR